MSQKKKGEKKLTLFLSSYARRKQLFFLHATKAQGNTDPEHIITFLTSLVQAVWQQLKVLFSLVCWEVSWLLCLLLPKTASVVRFTCVMIPSILCIWWEGQVCELVSAFNFIFGTSRSTLMMGTVFWHYILSWFSLLPCGWQQFCMWCLLPVSISKRRFNERTELCFHQVWLGRPLTPLR